MGHFRTHAPQQRNDLRDRLVSGHLRVAGDPKGIPFGPFRSILAAEQRSLVIAGADPRLFDAGAD
jgi:hypothetical protein